MTQHGVIKYIYKQNSVYFGSYYIINLNAKDTDDGPEYVFLSAYEFGIQTKYYKEFKNMVKIKNV